MHVVVTRRGLSLASVAVLTAVTAAGPAQGQSASARDTLLERLTTEATAANPALRAARLGAGAATARIAAAGALPDPTLNLGVMDLTLPRFAFHESDFTEVDIELAQEVPWPGVLGARTRAAQASARGRVAEAAWRGREVVVRTAALYYQLRYVIGARATLAKQRTLLSAAVGIATTRYASTLAPQSDPLQARVSLARLDAEAADLVAEEEKLRAALAAVRGVRRAERLSVEPIDAATAREASTALSDSGSLAGHPRVAAREAAVSAAESSERVERLGARPDFTIMARYGARPLGSDFFSAFVGIRLPLYASRKQVHLAAAARAETEAARAALEEERQTLASELASTRAEAAASAARLLLLLDEVIPSAQATADASLRAYRLGQVDFLNVLATADALYRAELDADRSAADHLARLVMLRQLATPGETP